MQNLKVVDLFAGTGAFSHVLEQYGCETVFANDMCIESEKIYNLNHNIALVNQDLNEVNVEDIPEHDILCGGFPCQPFSIAGKRKGFDDVRSNVFWKIIKILKAHKPKIIILENVKNLQSHDNGNTFNVISDALKKEKYHIKYKILNTCEITNIPQNRERIYIVGFKNKKTYDKFNFTFKNKIQKSISELLEPNVDNKYYYTKKYSVFDKIKNDITKHIDTNTIYQYRRYYVRENKGNVCPTLTANMGSGGHNVPLIRDDKGIRKLTPRECFNIQGFPDNYLLPAISDSKLYKLAGNAISVPVMELIAEKLNFAIECNKNNIASKVTKMTKHEKIKTTAPRLGTKKKVCINTKDANKTIIPKKKIKRRATARKAKLV